MTIRKMFSGVQNVCASRLGIVGVDDTGLRVEPAVSISILILTRTESRFLIFTWNSNLKLLKYSSVGDYYFWLWFSRKQSSISLRFDRCEDSLSDEFRDMSNFNFFSPHWLRVKNTHQSIVSGRIESINEKDNIFRKILSEIEKPSINIFTSVSGGLAFWHFW